MNRKLEWGEESFTHSASLDLACLLLFSAFVAFGGLAAGPRLGLHEAIVAQGAREIRQGGDWLIPRVNGIPELKKPPLAYWLAALSSRIVESPAVEPPVQ